MERIYPNQFARIGVSDEEVLARVEAAFHTIFFDPEEKFYHDVDDGSGCRQGSG